MIDQDLLMHRKSVFSTLALGTLLVTAASVSAVSQPSLNYLSASYLELDDYHTFDGFKFEISGQVSQRFFLSGSYAEVSSSSPSADRDITHARLGYLAFNQEGLQLFAGPQVQYISHDIPNSSSTHSDTRFGLFAGTQYRFTENLELNAEISYAYVDEGDDSTFLQYSLGGRYYVLSRLSVDGKLRFGDFDGFMIGLSLHF